MKGKIRKVGNRVMTPNGHGVIIDTIGKPPKGKQYLVQLDQMIFPHYNFYYSPSELK